MFGSKRRRAASNPVRVYLLEMLMEIGCNIHHGEFTSRFPLICALRIYSTIANFLVHQPLNGVTAHSAATSAASQAFLKNRSSNASLSSAAAAAALKARPMTPTSVADVQTRRTLKRSGSTSSVGSSFGGSQRSATPQLERRLSGGSMSERSFRDPSPGPSRPVPSAADAPPVPAIPQHIRTDSHRRASSMEAPPQRVSSPVNRNPAGRGSSLGPQGTAVAAARRTDQRSSLDSVSELTYLEQRRGSVNFSYPTDSRPGSPTQKRLTSPSPSRILYRANPPPRINTPDNQSLVYDPNTRSFLPAVTVHSIQQNINDIANQPVKKKKRAPPGNAQGTHLTDATVGGRPKGTAVDALRVAEKQQSQPIQQVLAPAPPQPQQEPQQLKVTRVESIFDSAPEVAQATKSQVSPNPPAPVPKKTKKRVVINDSSGDEGPRSSDNESESGLHGGRKQQSLAKKPSIVREDPEREEKEDDTPKRAKPALIVTKNRTEDRDISPSPLPRSKASKLHRQDSHPPQPLVQETPRSVSQPPASVAHIEPINEPIGVRHNGSIRGARVSSLSPGRVAHFAATPDQLTVKHQPPPRSISPIKSALKHSNSRNGSPMPANISETSGSPNGDEQPLPRKKANRVSFDERNVVVGDAAPSVTNDSPVAPSPQVSKKPWYSIGRGKKKDTVSTDDEEDEVMKPRPALPSFGSVRERKVRTEVEERPLVKPADPTEHKPVKPSTLPSPVAEVNENPLGQSNDHIVGAILAQDSQNRNEANISKSREPLPPQVTSVEGSGYHSDTDSSVSAGDTSTPGTVATEPEVVKAAEVSQMPAPGLTATVPNSAAVSESALVEKKIGNDSDTDDAPTPTQELAGPAIPQIAISLPTPTEDAEKRDSYLDIPGSWNDTTSDSDFDEPQQQVRSTTAVNGVAGPKPSVAINTSPQVETQHILNSTIQELPEESESEVFSDAAEELTDSDNEGFQSLNAAVDSPITTIAMKLPEPPESPTAKVARKKAELEENTKANGDWNQAQSYWSSLSADKKKQLELAALRDAESSDTEVEMKPVPKPKKKKKAVRPDPPQETVSSERSYMIKPGSKAGAEEYTPMRKSMRFEPPPPLAVDAVITRRSMRGPDQGSMRNSMRGSNQNNTMQTRNRPVSLPAAPRNDNATNKHSRNLSSASAAAASNNTRQPAPPAQPALRRKKSSDSESSFKRARPSAERSMMRTMRTTNNQPQQTMSSKNSVRSLSPTDSVARRPFGGFASQASNDSSSMRMSMRGNTAPAPTMRGSAGRAKSPSGGSIKLSFGFGSKNAKPQKAGKASSSRFADSSDEEDARPAFRSRFNDSSDGSDDDIPTSRPSALGRTLRNSAPAPAPASTQPPAYTPVRGIPKRTDTEDVDSSDLPDSDDEKPISGNQAKLSKKRQTNGSSSQGANLASGSLRRSGSGRETLTAASAPPLSERPSQKRRGSLMSILRRKKDDPLSKVRKSDAESPARRDTPLERSKSDLQALKYDVKTPPHSPKLQKRNPLSRENSAIPSSPQFAGLTDTNAPIITNDGRPYTANAAEDKEMGLGLSNGAASIKPNLGTRRYTADALGGISGGVSTVGISGGINGQTKKKKKFGSLRRMFGLHD